ncbi:hypothetical protein [uncultured Mucilaginibacter sp.]|uniref:hypothetical protein n=1 Tax=uncultured Mucilaginibacter sp. TaxID=797541 RepID=UPI0025D2BA91|nr:hypothetical protein [uncultured Mucilaginibacter sp.]
MRYLTTLIFLVACQAVIGGVHAVKFVNNRGSYLVTDTDKTSSPKKRSLSVGASYGTDASFFGRTSPQRYPYLTSDVIYNGKSGLFAYGSMWKVFNSPPTIDEFDLGAGYSYKFNKDIKGSISYTHFFFSDSARVIKSASSNDINIKNSFDWHLLKSTITMDYLYGQSNDFFLTIGHSHYFESNFNIFDDKDYITFEPSFNVILGTQNFVENFSYRHDFFFDHDDPSKPPPNGKPVYPNDYAEKNTEFNVLDYYFRLPISYNRPHYTIEASYKYSIPVNVQGSLFNSNESFFNLTFYYLFY